MFVRDPASDRLTSAHLLGFPVLPDWPPLERAPAVDLAPWHAERPHLVANALATVGQLAPHLSGLARLVIPRMARKVLATSTLKTAAASSGVMLLDDAIEHEHIGVRTPSHAYAVVVDCDHADWPELVEELAGYGLPRPTWICADPWTGRAHLVWFLRDAVLLTEAGRAAPVHLLGIVSRLLTAAFRGDPAYTGTLTKNPWRAGRAITRSGLPPVLALWEGHWRATPAMRHAVIPAPALHDLSTLRRALQAWQDDTGAPVPGRRRKTAEVDSERGRRLFDGLRHRVYAAWPCSEPDVQGMAADEAARLGSPISGRQRDSMARRVHQWCTRHYTARRTAAGRETNRGRDRLETSGLDLAEKQAVAGRNTAEARARARPGILEEAAARLLARGLTLTKAALATEAGCSARTVQRTWRGGDIRCPSGGAPAGAPLGPKAPPTKNQNSLSSSLASRAAMDRRLKGVVTQLGELAAAAMRPGAIPPAMIEIPADLSGSLPVRKAVMMARQAIQDGERRAADRAAKQAAVDRFAEFTAAAAGPFPMTWWSDYRAALDAEFDAREQEPGLDRHAVARVRVQREATFAARWRLWRKVNRPQPVPRPPADPVAVVSRAQLDAEFLAEMDRVFGPG